jgi:hypothetical protein
MVAADHGNLNRIVQKLEDHERKRAVEKLKTDAADMCCSDTLSSLTLLAPGCWEGVVQG